MNLQEYIDSLKPQPAQKTSQQIQLENILAQARKAGEEIRSKIGQPLATGFGNLQKKTYDTTMKVLNPGSTWVAPQLKKWGVSPLIAGGVGLGLDIIAPGPSEWVKGGGVLKGASRKITQEAKDIATDFAYKGLKELQSRGVRIPLDTFSMAEDILTKIEKGKATMNELNEARQMIKLNELTTKPIEPLLLYGIRLTKNN